ncbi:MAG: response regulator [Myxococcota bacterium]
MASQTILVVDDNALNRKLLRDLLTKRGYRVEQAEDGVQAVAVASRIMPDLVIMDLIMPNMDGFEATRAIKSKPELHHIPILALSAMSGEQDRARALEAGCVDFLRKPFGMEEILGALARLIRARA